jgi:predicted DCC family thiol-disulfide oxidoreductase YuxK
MDKAQAPNRPTLYWDGDCGFCRRWVDRWREITGEHVQYAPLQTAPAAIQNAAGGKPFQSIVYQDPNGQVVTGAAAALSSISTGARWATWLLSVYHHLPGFAMLAELAYRLIAKHRTIASRASWLLWGADSLKPRYDIAGYFFPRGVGLVLLIAFLSLWTQIDGLYGSRGLLPVAQHLEMVRQSQSADSSYGFHCWQIPSLLWVFGSSDVAMQVLLGLGCLASLLLLLGLLPALNAFLAWMIYLSFVAACPIFLSFQWDALLLETTLLLLFYLQWKVWLGRQNSEPWRIGRLLVWWLLFRLMFMSGIAKLHGYDASGLNTWLDGTALQFHYFTQPIPAWTSWWFAQLPDWFHRVSVWIVLFIELVLPFFIFGPRRFRLVAFSGFTGLMLLIMLSGNYGFFNILTLTLSLTLLDNSLWPRWVQKYWKTSDGDRLSPRISRHRIREIFWIALALVFFSLGAVQLLASLQMISREHAWRLTLPVAPLRSINPYGLFSVMTTERPEIFIELSRDGENWTPVKFRYKIDPDKNSAPLFSPHMPRLDWQMWFAALEMRETGQLPGWMVPLLLNFQSPSPGYKKLFADNSWPKDVRFFRITLGLLTFVAPENRRPGESLWQTQSLPEYTIRGQFPDAR